MDYVGIAANSVSLFFLFKFEGDVSVVVFIVGSCWQFLVDLLRFLSFDSSRGSRVASDFFFF